MRVLCHHFACASRHSLSRAADYVTEPSFGEHVSSEASGILFLTARRSAAFPVSRPLHLEPHPQRMHRYALLPAPLYTPVSSRAPLFWFVVFCA